MQRSDFAPFKSFRHTARRLEKHSRRFLHGRNPLFYDLNQAITGKLLKLPNVATCLNLFYFFPNADGINYFWDRYYIHDITLSRNGFALAKPGQRNMIIFHSIDSIDPSTRPSE